MRVPDLPLTVQVHVILPENVPVLSAASVKVSSVRVGPIEASFGLDLLFELKKLIFLELSLLTCHKEFLIVARLDSLPSR